MASKWRRTRYGEVGANKQWLFIKQSTHRILRKGGLPKLIGAGTFCESYWETGIGKRRAAICRAGGKKCTVAFCMAGREEGTERNDCETMSGVLIERLTQRLRNVR